MALQLHVRVVVIQIILENKIMEMNVLKIPCTMMVILIVILINIIILHIMLQVHAWGVVQDAQNVIIQLYV